MNLATVMDQLATRLRSINGLRVTAYPDGNVEAPAAIVAMPSAYDYDGTYGRGSDTLTLPVVVLVSNQVPRTARDQLAAYCDGSGPSSIKATVESGAYTAFDVPVVTSVEFDIYTSGGQDYAAAIFSIDVTGHGS